MLVLSFLVPFVIAVLACTALHIAPFGNHTLVISDARSLFVSDLSYFSRLVKGEEGLLYSFESGIGMNIVGMIGGMLDPVNLLVLAFDITNYAVMFTWVIVVSIALCGLSMYHFLSSTYECDDTSHLIFSTVYALMGFNVAYCFLYTFIFVVALLPFLALGIRKILLGKRPWLYVGALAYAVVSNYYMAYMLCIASIVLFCMWLIKDGALIEGNRRGLCLTFVFSTLCAGMLGAIVWLPSILSLAGGRLDQNTLFDLTFNENMSLLDMGAKFFAGANSTDQLVDGLPNVFCGSFVLYLTVLFFFDSRNSKRAKLVYGVVLGLFFLTFYIKAFSMAMHGFSDTNWFNHRYSYVFTFVMILMAVEEFGQIRSVSCKEIKQALAVLVVIVVAVFSKQYEFVAGGSMLLDMAILALVLAGILWHRRDQKRAPMAQLVVLILILCSVELYANFYLCLTSVQDWELKADEYQTDLFYGSIIADSVQASDAGLYRMANEHHTNERCSNDPRLFGYNGTTYFGSNGRNSVFRELCHLGQPWYGNRMWYAEGEPAAFDTLLGLKYCVSRRDLTQEKGYESAISIGEDTVYINRNALPLGVLANTNQVIPDMGIDPFANHNAIWKGLTGENEDVFTEETNVSFVYRNGIDGAVTNTQEALSYSMSVAELEPVSNSTDSSPQDSSGSEKSDTGRSGYEFPYWVECSFVASQDGPIYSYDAGLVSEAGGYTLEPIHYLGTYKAGDMVTTRIDLPLEANEKSFNVVCAEYRVAYANDDVLNRYSSKLQSESDSIERVSDDHLAGDVEAAYDGRLFFTIPYDEGWTLTVDGNEVPLEMDAGLFMSAPIGAGSHSYTLTFFPKGMRLGMIISGVGVLCTIALIAFDLCGSKKREIADKNVEVAA